MAVVEAPIKDIRVSVFTIPTETPESDGTLEWHATTMALVRVSAGGDVGLGYTYADVATGRLIETLLTDHLRGKDALATAACWMTMRRAIRNLGGPGICAMAISAVDTALWDLKAKLLGVPLVILLGAVRDAVPLYGSGGFTSYAVTQLESQLAGWVADGIPRVKMKIGRDSASDIERVERARRAIGDDAELFVDANGAYTRKQALELAFAFSESHVRWFEEPVSSDDLAGLHLLRNRAPVGMDISAGEYGYDAGYFRRMLSAQAVDVLQADATRCGGFTGFLNAAALCEAFEVPLSSHCAPYLHRHVACAARPQVHAEYFFDHVRIEHMLFDGATEPRNGKLFPDLSRPGLGLVLKEQEAAKYAI